MKKLNTRCLLKDHTFLFFNVKFSLIVIMPLEVDKYILQARLRLRKA